MDNNTQRNDSPFSSMQRSDGNVTYGTPPAVVSGQITDGGEFIVIARTRQGEEPKVWATGDKAQTEHLFRQAYTNLAFEQPVAA